MIKAGALYFAIVIAFVMAIISASLITLAMHYRSIYLKETRFTRLLNNLKSGVELVLAPHEEFKNTKIIDLYADQADSLIIDRKQWGLFDLVLLKAFISHDTLKKAMLIGVETDSTVIYLSDEDRPLSLSGKTKISGNVYLPKSGVRKAYAEGKSYINNKLIYSGSTSSSSRKLKPLNPTILATILNYLTIEHTLWPTLNQKEVNRSFMDSTLCFNLKSKAQLKNIKLTGNIMLFADSSITVSASSHLDGIQIYAPYIKIETGFIGNCQFFASDSITIDSQVHLSYPSVAAIIRTKKTGEFPKIVLKKEVNFEGVLFTYEEKRTALQTMISIDSGSVVKGEIYSTGLLKFVPGVQVNGKVSCNKLLMQTSSLLYENFLIDITLNRPIRSPYYLSSPLFNSNLQKKLLKWLD